MSKNVKKVAPPSDQPPADAPIAAAQEETAAEPQVKKIKKPAKNEAQAEPEAAIAVEEPQPVNPIAGLRPGMENPPLHLLNQQYQRQDEERRAADPLAGMEALIGERAKQKLLRRLPESEAAAERARLAQNFKRHRADGL